VTIEHAGRTDTGRVRSRNEDCFACIPDLGLYVVADGMGGHQGGAEASRHACEAIEAFVRSRHEVVRDLAADPSPGNRRQVLRILGEAVRSANDRIVLAAEEDADLACMGSTVLATLLAGDRAFVAHVGDSRAYLLRDGAATLLTEDHSLLFELIRQGRLTRQSAARFPMKNVVTRALGVRGAVEADTLELPLLPGDRLLLCSDGLHTYVDDDRLFRAAGEGAPEAVAERLVQVALNAGGADNVTVLLADVVAIDGDPQAVRAREERVRALPVFRGLSASELLHLMAACEHRRLAAGETVFRAGEVGDGMYGVIDGAVEIRNGDARVQRFGPGTHFGEMSLLEDRPRLVSAVAAQPTDLFVLTRRTFEGLQGQAPCVAVRILRQLVLTLAQRLRDANDERVILKGMLDAQAVDAPNIVSSEMLQEETSDA